MEKDQLSRKLAVILHADVVGSTSLVQQDEALAHQRIQDTFQRFSIIISRHGGFAHEIRGDALVAEFARASDAASASIAFQTANTSHNDQLSDEIRPELRVGIAMGEVVVADNTVTGGGVVLAQRLEQLAAEGGTCIQGAAYETLPKWLPFDYEYLGEQQVKGFDETVRAYAVDLQPGAAIPEPESLDQPEVAAPGLHEKPSIAVLPFTNMSGNPKQEYFADGITEDIITELSRFKNLFVCARHSSFTFKGKTVDVKTAGRELDANYIVEGSVRKVGNRVRVTVQLVSADSGSHIWAERYDRDLDDIFAVQDEVVSSVVAQLGVSLRREAMEFIRGRPTDNLTAYDNLLHARAAWWRGEWNEGFSYTQSALEADPDYAQAHAWMALQYAYQTYGRSMGLTDDEICIGAKRHAEEALRLNDQDPFIHMAASMAFGFTPIPDKHRGLRHSNISYDMNPHDFDVLYCRAYHLAWNGRPLEALTCLKRLDDLNPLAGFMLGECYADIYYLLERYEDCLNCYQGQGEAPSQVKVLMAASLAKLDRVVEAKSYMEELRRHDPDFDVEGFARGNIALCANDRDAERLRTGFRLSGVNV